jgi:hypothetical protein
MAEAAIMDAAKAKRVDQAARKMDRALKLLDQARNELNACGAYEDDDMFAATSSLTDALSATSAAFTSTHMAVFTWRQNERMTESRA